jgi:threonine dehydratase
VVVPDHAPQAKLAAIERFGAKIIKVPFSEWWEIIVTGKCKQAEGYFVHPVCDSRVIEGNATIGLESILTIGICWRIYWILRQLQSDNLTSI